MTLISLALFASAAYVQIDTFGMNLKGTETRSTEVAMGVIETLSDQGVLDIESDSEQVWELSRLIQQPIEDQIFITQRDYIWTSKWMAVLGVILLLVTWFPSKKSESN